MKCRVTQKTIFRTEVEILGAAKSFARPLFHYQCPHCNGWHFTKYTLAEYMRRRLIGNAARQYARMNET